MASGFLVDIHVIGLCNMSCKFCCGSDKYVQGPPLADLKRVFRKLKCLGCGTVVLTGGEPLLRKDIVEMIRYASGIGLNVYLSTNGLLLQKYYPQIKDHLACIGLPLDGSSKELNAEMSRDPKLYDSTLSNLRYIKRHKHKHIVKLGTVVTSINIADIPNIASLIYGNSLPVDVWRLYQFSPLKRGKLFKKRYSISTASYNQAVNNVMSAYPNKKIVPLSDTDSNNSYVFINPLLEIEILKGDKFFNKGNILRMDDSQLNKIFASNKEVIDRGKSNRRWLYVKSN